MQTNNAPPSFFDPKTILAIVAVAAMYFGWQAYLNKKYPGYGQKPVVNSTETAVPVAPAAGGADQTQATPAREAEVKKEEKLLTTQEQLFPFDSEKLGFTLTSRGMGLKKVLINNYLGRDNEKVHLAASDTESLFEMSFTPDLKPLDFDVKEISPGHFIGTAKLGEMGITRELTYIPENNSFSNVIKISNASDQVLKGFSLIVPEKIHTAASSSFFFPSYEHQDFVVTNNGGSHTSVNFSGAKENLHKDFPVATLVAAGSQYFASAVLDKSDFLPNVVLTSDVASKTAHAVLMYKPDQVKPDFVFNQILYAGPKAIDSLKSIDPEMVHILDFGFFGMISRPLLYIMKAFHAYVGNWGLSIILLTLLVRLCVLPFNIMSIRSMKAMQKIQPKLQALREKYKEDPMTMNKETMALMKQNGANPLGGCLPMLVQIPIFFALYRVIGSSIELYHAPFMLWITDLSSHDKFYVLPVLMGATMFFQQKLTPTTMDPMQAKIMMFLPLVFCLFMLQLPSGLTLYMFVSGLFGIIQQVIIMRDRKAEAKS